MQLLSLKDSNMRSRQIDKARVFVCSRRAKHLGSRQLEVLKIDFLV